MSCGCLKKNITEADKARAVAEKVSKLEKTDYVIYEENGKTYFDRKSCWEKAGKPGKAREIIYHIQ